MCCLCDMCWNCCISFCMDKESNNVHHSRGQLKGGTKFQTVDSSLEGLTKSSTKKGFDLTTSDRVSDEDIGVKIDLDQPLRFQSPSDSIDESLDSHRKRLELRGYRLDSVIPFGSGVFGWVFVVTQIKDKQTEPGARLACKVLKNRELNDSTQLLRDLFKEWTRLKTSEKSKGYEHVNHYFAQFTFDMRFTYVVMGLSDRGSLEQRLVNSEKLFSETEVGEYFAGIASAINFMHSREVAHRNLKLDNVLLFATVDGKEVVKVSDYGLSRVALKNKYVVMYVRDAKSITYMSPQILKYYAKHLLKKNKKKIIKEYDVKAGDIWALGICLYYLLFKTPAYGLPPDCRELAYINPNHAIELRCQYLKDCLRKFDTLDIPRRRSKELSQECKDILKELLTPKVRRRIDHYGVIRHRWYQTMSERIISPNQ